MKTINITTATMIMMALELISFSYAPNREKQKKNIKSVLSYTNSWFTGSSSKSRDSPQEMWYRKYVKHPDNDLLRRTFLMDYQNQYLSAFHDVLLFTGRDGVYSMVVEMPRETVLKMEINAAEPLNPIAVDVVSVNSGVPPRNAAGVPWNLGALPQTWQNPALKDKWTQLFGNGGQLGVIEIGGRNQECGKVVPVKVLGAYQTINSIGQTDWKVVAIAVDDPNAAGLNDIGELHDHLVATWDMLVEWLNRSGVSETTIKLNAIQAAEVIREKYNLWFDMHKQNKKIVSGINLTNTTLQTFATVKNTEAENIVNNA